MDRILQALDEGFEVLKALFELPEPPIPLYFLTARDGPLLPGLPVAAQPERASNGAEQPGVGL